MKGSVKLWVCALFTTTIVLWRLNPHLFLYYKNRAEILPTPLVTLPTLTRTLKSSCEPTAQFRYDSGRTGVAPLSATPSVAVKVSTRIRPFNVGIHNASKSTPVIDDTGIYIGSDSGWFFKFDHQGQVLWRFYVPGAKNGIHGSAAVDDKKVYFGAYNGALYALDKMSGAIAWTHFVGDFIGSSPLLADGGLLISAETKGADGLVARLDCNSGQLVWQSDWLGGHSHSSPAFDPKTRLIFTGANSGRLFAHDIKTGETRWTLQTKGPIKGTPMVFGSSVFISSWDRHLYSVNVSNGDVQWKTYMGGKLQTSLTPVPGANIGLTNTRAGELAGVDLSSGEIVWRLRHGDPNHMSSFLVTKSRDGYLGWNRCKRTKLCVLQARSGKLIKAIDLDGPFTSVPVAYQNQIYISLDGTAGLLILE